MSSESHIELYRLAAFEVLPRQRETLVTPYVAAHRGYIELHSRIEHVEFT
jgi:hypothetical protein